MPNVHQVSTLHTDILELLDKESTGASSGRYSESLLNRKIDGAQERLHALLSGLGWADWLLFASAVEVNPEDFAGLNSIPLPYSPTSDGESETASWWRISTDGWYPDSDQFAPGVVAGDVAPGVFRVHRVWLLDDYSSTGGSDAFMRVYTWNNKARLLEEASSEELWQDIESRAWTYSDPPRYRLMGNNTLVFDRKSPTKAAFLIEYTAVARTVTTSSYLQLQPMWSRYIVADVVADLAERDREFALADRQRAKLQQYADEIMVSARRRHAAPKRFRDDQSDGELVGHQEMRDRLTYGRWWP